jgi:peroxiredoxin
MGEANTRRRGTGSVGPLGIPDGPPFGGRNPLARWLRARTLQLQFAVPELFHMVRTPSTMVPLGTLAPDFELPNVDGRMVSYANAAGSRGTVVMFICNHCPFVKHVADQLATLGREYMPRGIGFVAISSNDVSSHPADSPEQMVAEAEERGYVFPYLYDETQDVAKAYHAACTPDFYAFDAAGKLVYRGQLDPSRPGSEVPVSGADLRRALDSLLAGGPSVVDQVPSLGCNIKWKAGNEPPYFNP